MQLNFKKLLLAGTALVAVTSFGTQAQAATQTLTVSPTEWGNSGTPVAGNGDGTAATAGDDAVMTTFNLTVTNDNTNNDGSANKNTFALGAVTATTGDFLITDGQAVALTATVGSFSSGVGGNFSVIGTNANTAGITATVTNAATVGGTLIVHNQELDAADAIVLNVGGALSVTGTTAVTAGAGAFANTAALTVGGNATFTDAVTVTGGVNVGALATLTLNGTTNTFTGGLALNDGAGGAAQLKLAKATAQTVGGTITGTGDIFVDNAAGVTFSGEVTAGSITIENAGGSSGATFKNNVTSGIKLGTDGVAGTNTLTLDGTTQAFAVTGAIAGTAGETNAIKVLGGKTITLAGAGSTADLNTLAISGTGTKLVTGQNLTVTTTTVASGTTLANTANLIKTNSTLTGTGTINLTGTGTYEGTIDGATAGVGILDVDANSTVTGSVGTTKALSKIDVATGAALLVTSAGATNVIATSTVLGGAGSTLTVTPGADNAITTNITTAGATGTGAFNIGNGNFKTTITGNVGTSTLKLATMAIQGGAANTVTTTGNLYVNAITIDAADTLQFLGTTQAVSGTTDGGTILVGNGTTLSNVTFSGAHTNGAATTVAAKSTAHLNANHTTAGAFTNTGTTYAKVGTVLTAGSFDGVGTVHIEVKDGGVLGTAEAGDTARIVSGGAINTGTGNIVINYTGNAVAGTYKIGDAGAASTLDAAVVDNSFQFNSVVALNGQDTELTITRNTFAAVGTTGNNDSMGTMLETINNTTNAEISQAIDNIANASTQAAANEVMESMIPTVDGGHMVAAANVTNNSFGLMGDRLAALRTETTGMAAGNGTMGHRLWAQGFGSTATQDHRDGVDGYDAETFGGTVGIDTETITDNGIMGVAFSFANTEVDSDNANRTNSDIDSYQIALYGDYDLDQTTWINGMAAYAWNDVSMVRNNVGGIAGLTARGDFDANQFTAQAAVGRDYTYESMILAPSFLAHWTHYDPDGYTETGAGGLNQVVTQDSVDIFELGVGIDASWQYQTASGMEVEPSLHAGARYDLVGDEVNATARFTGAGAAFSTQGADPAQASFNVGAGMKLYTTDSWEFSANYDFDFKSDYDAHAGYLRAGVKF